MINLAWRRFSLKFARPIQSSSTFSSSFSFFFFFSFSSSSSSSCGRSRAVRKTGAQREKSQLVRLQTLPIVLLASCGEKLEEEEEEQEQGDFSAGRLNGSRANSFMN